MRVLIYPIRREGGAGRGDKGKVDTGRRGFQDRPWRTPRRGGWGRKGQGDSKKKKKMRKTDLYCLRLRKGDAGKTLEAQHGAEEERKPPRGRGNERRHGEEGGVRKRRRHACSAGERDKRRAGHQKGEEREKDTHEKTNGENHS